MGGHDTRSDPLASAAGDLSAAGDPSMAVPRSAAAGRSADELTSLILVRHGPTPMTLRGGHSGGSVPGPSLTKAGHLMARQAAVAITRLAEFWPEIPVPSAMYSSPMVRVQETAAPIAERLGLTPVVDDRLREMEFGQWEGLTHSEIETGWPGDYERWRSEGTFAPPGGESHVDLAARIGPALGEIVESHRGEAVVVVAHAAVNRTAFGRASGMDSSRWSSLRVPPASLTILNHWPTATELVTLGFPTGWV